MKFFRKSTQSLFQTTLAVMLLVSCKQDSLSDYMDDALSGSVQLSVNLSNSFTGGTGATSPWVHLLQESMDLTISSTTSTFTQTITFNPSDPSSFPSTTLPYDSYTWTVANTGSTVPVASSLYVYGSSATPFSVGSATTILPLTLDTDFALVTVTTTNIDTVSVTQNANTTNLSTQDNYYYAYINSLFTDFTIAITSSDGMGATNSIAAPIAKTHYNYILNYPNESALSVTLELIDNFILEDVNVDMVDLDSDGDGVADALDQCPGTPTGTAVDEFGCNLSSAVFLDANGITVKAVDGAIPGDGGTLNGIAYTIVDEATLRAMINNGENVEHVVTTLVTNMADLMNGRASFNQDISTWDTSNVTSMRYLLNAATAFNQDISSWDVSKVGDFEQALSGCVNFNQDLNDWNVSSATNMRAMFGGCSNFNSNIASWDVSNARSMSFMFNAALSFNQDISSWDTRNVSSMDYMFSNTRDFNQDISSWNVQNVSNMVAMFENSVSFNHDISAWDVTNVSNMLAMFNNTGSFNQNLSGWSVNNVFSCLNFSANAPQWTLSKPNFTNCTP